MLTLFIRTIIIYFALLLALRLMGKRQIGELRVSELIITLILSEIAVQKSPGRLPCVSEWGPLPMPGTLC